jgi:hypothetical protein
MNTTIKPSKHQAVLPVPSAPKLATPEELSSLRVIQKECDRLAGLVQEFNRDAASRTRRDLNDQVMKDSSGVTFEKLEALRITKLGLDAEYHQKKQLVKRSWSAYGRRVVAPAVRPILERARDLARAHLEEVTGAVKTLHERYGVPHEEGGSVLEQAVAAAAARLEITLRQLDTDSDYLSPRVALQNILQF